MFERAGFQVLGAPADDLSSDPDRAARRLELAHLVFRELVARVYYRLSG